MSDGEASSPDQHLRVSTYPLSIKLKHNTGLVVVHHSFSYLTPFNLSFATNAEDSRVEIRYTMVKVPIYGIIQRQRDPNQPWTTTKTFTSRELEDQLVRYLHNVGSPLRDNFKFQAAVREVQSPATYDFNITFIILELLEVYRNPVNFSNSAEVVLDSKKLKFQTNPLATSASMILYSLLETPRFAHLYLDYDRLRIGQTFSQQDIDSGRLRYRHFRRAFSSIDDHILFKVTAPQCSDLTTSLNFHYQLSADKSNEAMEVLHVQEGRRVALRTSRLSNLGELGVTALSFNLTERPRHGCLSIYNGSLPVRPNTSHFSSEELAAQSIFYVHDDSETEEDSFEFLAMSTDETDLMYIGHFLVNVSLRNDNPPKRINQRIFHVVQRSEKLITRADLLYTDDDLGTRASKITYRVKQLSNGQIYRLNEPMYYIDKFSQQDIDDEKIVYKHQGSKYERIDFTVSDGDLFSNGDLEIQAGQPYAKLLMLNTEGVVVQSNRSVILTSRDIDVETNVYANATDMLFTLLERPKYGVLLKHGREISAFNRDELARNLVIYKHIGLSLKEDQFRLSVKVHDAEDSRLFVIKVLPESYWEPLMVLHNSTVYVEEATSVLINRKSLEIGYPDIPPSRIKYHVREWPRHGYLEVQTHEEAIAEQQNQEEDEPDFGTHLVKHFEQNLVNDGRVYYVQSAPNKTHDRFVVDVSNGISWLRNLSVNIVIVPDKLYVAARNMTVLEGKSIVLHEADIYAVTAYFAGKITDYEVIEKPRHGNVLNAINAPTTKFTHKQLAERKIVYKNNGDEVATDSFRMIVVAGMKRSEPFDVWINVVPINDEVPIVVNRTNFGVWQGGSMRITRNLLAAVDNDSLPSELMFNVNNVIRGFFSLVSSPTVVIHNFSQELINKDEVLFTHTSKREIFFNCNIEHLFIYNKFDSRIEYECVFADGSEAEFSFSVSDGQHATETHRIAVSTKPVEIVIERNRVLSVFPQAKKPINSDLLLSVCTDSERDVKYFVRRSPGMGKIIMETSDGTWLEVDRFTQKDLNNSKIAYEHKKQFNNLSASDSFIFDVETHFAAPIKNQV